MNGQARTILEGWGGKSVNHSVQDDGGTDSFTKRAVECKKRRLSDRNG